MKNDENYFQKPPKTQFADLDISGDSPKTNGKQMVNKQKDGTFAPGHTLGNRFPKGQSGNRSGRPKLTRLTDALREQLAEINPHAPEETIAEEIAKTLISMALAGDVQAIKEVFDRCEGKPKQSIDLDVQATSWQEQAKKHGVTEQDVINEAKLLIAESDIDSSD
jgi:hypothetical protein